MGQGLDVLRTCDGEGHRRDGHVNEIISDPKRGSTWGEDGDVSCAALEDGFKQAVATANRGGTKISDEVLLNHDLLHHARQGNVKGVSAALERGAWTETRRPLVMKPQKPDATKGTSEKDVPESGMTALMFSSQYGSAECVRRLVWANADVNALEEDGWSPLHFAAKECHIEVCQILLQAKADPKLQNTDDQTPLQVAEAEDRDFGIQFKKLLKKQGYE